MLVLEGKRSCYPASAKKDSLPLEYAARRSWMPFLIIDYRVCICSIMYFNYLSQSLSSRVLVNDIIVITM